VAQADPHQRQHHQRRRPLGPGGARPAALRPRRPLAHRSAARRRSDPAAGLHRDAVPDVAHRRLQHLPRHRHLHPAGAGRVAAWSHRRL
ncbi:MAG: hypothetical protein AVDCRST_MAG07-247, partial [uncultured Frankineae bacterium]